MSREKSRKHLAVDARYLKPRSTGVGHYIKGILQGLDLIAEEQGIQVSAFRLPTTDVQLLDFWHSLNNVRSHVVNVDPEHHPRNEFWLTFPLSSWMKHLKAQVLFSPAFVGPVTPRNYRMVLCLHDALVWDFPENYPTKFRLYLQMMARLSAKKADLVVCPSPGAREQIEGHRLADPEIVPYGLDLETFYPARRNKKRSDPIKAVFLASFERRKNHQILFEALSISPANKRSIELTLIHHATPSEKDRIENKAGNLDLHIVNPENQEAIAEAFRQADFSVLPSLAEGFGAPALESMACGCPVILSSTNWFKLLSGNGERAYLANPYDADEWSVAIDQLLSDKKGTETKVKKALEYSQKFKWERSASDLIRLIDERQLF